MPIRFAVDIATRVSPELSAMIEMLTGDADREEPPTLDEVRAAVEEANDRDAEDERRYPQDRTSVVAELDDLIEEFGGDALAVDFVVNKASEGLSRIIETAMSDQSLPRRPTLRVVREAMISGLTARLVGDGTLDPDEDGTLQAEIDGLIVQFGPDAMAENFVRFE